MVDIGIQDVALDARALESRVSAVTNGAVCTFTGQVRTNSRGREVSYLEYQAYVPMAEREMRTIAMEAEARWGCDVLLHHRLGRINPGEASVVICIGAPHRAEAFEACRYCIDELKERVPVWKRETCPDGSFWIEGEEALISNQGD